MNKEYQEATNEYLKVCFLFILSLDLAGVEAGCAEAGQEWKEEWGRQYWALGARRIRRSHDQKETSPQTNNSITVTKLRTYLRYLIRRLHRQRPSPKPTEINEVKSFVHMTFDFLCSEVVEGTTCTYH